MAVDPRDQVWDAAYFLWYDTKYNAELANRMVDRLKGLDDVSKVLVALTASGSVVAGWSLWSQGGFSVAWALLAGSGALLSIVHGSLGIPARLKDWLETKKDFLALRSDLDTLRECMRIDSQFDAMKTQETLNTHRRRFGELEGRIPSDFFATDGLKSRCQSSINAEIAGRMNGKQQENENEN